MWTYGTTNVPKTGSDVVNKEYLGWKYAKIMYQDNVSHVCKCSSIKCIFTRPLHPAPRPVSCGKWCE